MEPDEFPLTVGRSVGLTSGLSDANDAWAAAEEVNARLTLLDAGALVLDDLEGLA